MNIRKVESMGRTSEITRNTNETKILVKLDLDGNGQNNISTGIGLFDHMLQQLSFHSAVDMEIHAQGDLYVDGHHTIEDVGIALGKAIFKALGEKKAINRYGSAFVPMDEALAFVSLDISGRPYLVFDASFYSGNVGQLDTQLIKEFFRALAVHAGITLHIKLEYGENDHHKIEAIFKAFAKALHEALKIDQSLKGVASTKGVL